jgi:outer membrane protein assembly factor BamB
VWLFQTRGEVDSSPVICADAVVVGSGDGRLYCVGLADGKERWTYEIGAPVTASPAAADGAIVIGAEDGNVYCIGKPVASASK